MSKEREDELVADFKKLVGSAAHISTVESHRASPGIPDIDYCLEGGLEGKIECKYVEENEKVSIRPTQHQWFRARVAKGGHPFFLVRVRDSSGDYHHFLINGRRHQWHVNHKAGPPRLCNCVDEKARPASLIWPAVIIGLSMIICTIIYTQATLSILEVEEEVTTSFSSASVSGHTLRL